MEVNAAAGRRRRSGSTSNNNCSSTTTTTAAVERKEIERNRRLHMKSLCVKLASLVPKEHYYSKDAMTRVDSLDGAAAYIKKLKERVDELRRQKSSSAQLLATERGDDGFGASTSAAATSTSFAAEAAAEAPVVEVRHGHDPSESSLEVVLVSSEERPFKLHQVVTVLQEEGAEIINANLSVDGRKIFYTIHCQAFSPRIGIEVSRISERLRALVQY